MTPEELTPEQFVDILVIHMYVGDPFWDNIHTKAGMYDRAHGATYPKDMTNREYTIYFYKSNPLLIKPMFYAFIAANINKSTGAWSDLLPNIDNFPLKD